MSNFSRSNRGIDKFPRNGGRGSADKKELTSAEQLQFTLPERMINETRSPEYSNGMKMSIWKLSFIKRMTRGHLIWSY